MNDAKLTLVLIAQVETGETYQHLFGGNGITIVGRKVWGVACGKGLGCGKKTAVRFEQWVRREGGKVWVVQVN